MTKELEYKLNELTRFYGSIVGTPGISKDVQEHCNSQLFKLVKAFDPVMQEITAEVSGLILE